MLYSGFLVLVLQLAQATDAQFLACKQHHFEGLMSRYQTYFAGDVGLAQNLETRANTVATTFQADYDRAVIACDQRFPERNQSQYQSCLTSQSPNVCATRHPARNQTAHASCLEGAVKSGVQRFGSNFTADLGVNTSPAARAAVARFQSDYDSAVQMCTNHLDNSPINTAIRDCETAGAAAGQTCTATTSPSTATTATPATTTPGGSISNACSQSAGSSAALAESLQTQQTNCSSSLQSCESSCSNVQSRFASVPTEQRSEFASRVSSAASSCTSARSGLANIEAGLTQARSVQSRSATCMQDTGVQAVSDRCKANPNAEGCGGALAQNCSNPAFASQNLASCASSKTSAIGTGQVSGTSPQTSSLPSDANTSSTLGNTSLPADASTSTDSQNTAGNPNGSQRPNDGTKGDPAATSLKGQTGNPLSMQVSKTKTDEGSQAPTAKTPTGEPIAEWNAFSVRATSPEGPASEGSGSYNANGSWIPPKLEPGDPVPDLDQYRPQVGAHRAPASDALPSGILAAHVNIWKRMNQMYFRLTPTFLDMNP